MADQVKVCLNCGNDITGKRSDAKFCSTLCRNAYNWHNRGNVKDEAVPHHHLESTGTVVNQEPVGCMPEILAELREIKALLQYQKNQNERLLTIDNACIELDISKPTFERLQAEGLLKVHRFGGKETKGRGRKPYLLFSELVEALRNDASSKVE